MPAAELELNQVVLNRCFPQNQPYWDCWELVTDQGRQVWKFHLPPHLQHVVGCEEDWDKPEAAEFLKNMASAFTFDKSVQAHSADLVFRTHALKNAGFKPLPQADAPDLVNRAALAVNRGFHFYQSLQTSYGNWPGDYGGPLFLLPGLVIASHITQTPLSRPQAVLAKQYMLNMQNKDGGWGLHIEDDSTMLGTVLQYTALRLLGASPGEAPLKAAREWIHAHGGADYIPTWGKFYLAVLGVYEWKGFNSILPELWKFPASLPVHPSKYWCHTRAVHLPMAYCYAVRFSAPETPVTHALKNELYTISYDEINWKMARNRFCEKDIYTPHHWFLDLATECMNVYEPVHHKKFRKRTVNFLLEQIELENKNTSNINLGPVNHVMNAICLYHAYGNQHEAFKKQVARWDDYLWLAEDGLKMNGYNGSQFWDTNFAALAMLEGNSEKEFTEMARKIYSFLDHEQIKEEVDNRLHCDRSIRKGGYAFSTAQQGWPITDCTAEGMKTAILYAQQQVLPADQLVIDQQRLQDSVDLLLEYQNKDGGWASYEKTRGPHWLEILNAAEVFGDIMNDYSYAECTSACLQGLSKFQHQYPGYRSQEIQQALEKGNRFLKHIQQPDGSWLGSWAICFTYATWFGIEGLLATGEKDCTTTKTRNEIIRACDFLLAKQKADGGWGEHYLSSVKKEYVEHPVSQVTNTAWALLGLMAAQHPNRRAIERGIEFLLSAQDSWGDFPQQQISGVFNFNCMITYTSYRNVFPLWALNRYKRLYGNPLTK